MNLRPPGYEHPDSRLRRLRPSPLQHGVPSQPVHMCRHISTVSDRPGPSRLHIWLHPRQQLLRREALCRSSLPAQPVSRHALATHLQVHQESQDHGAQQPPVADERASLRPDRRVSLRHDLQFREIDPTMTRLIWAVRSTRTPTRMHRRCGTVTPRLCR